jgi:hypothetical protein
MDPAELPLRDIHLPAPPSWWPPAPGWWVLLAGLLAAGIALAWALRRRRRTRARRAALVELERIARRHPHGGHALAAEVSVLLRRLALALRPRAGAAGLTGDAWLDLLDTLAPRARLDPAIRRILRVAPYRRDCAFDSAVFVAACRRWLRSLPAGSAPGAAP